MMNNIKIVIAAAVVASVCSCGKEQIDNTPSPVVLDDSFTLDATLESTSSDSESKTTIGDIDGKNYAVWSASDKIDVYDATYNKITMSIAEKDGTYARFKIESTNGLEGEFTPLYAVYPAGIGTLSSKKLTFSTSDTQIYRDGSFADGCNVAVGTVQKINDVYSISFKNVFSYLKLNLKAEDATITIDTLELVANNGGKLSGEFSVSDISGEAPEAVATVNAGNDRIILDCRDQSGNGLKLEKGDTANFVFVVPCGSFASSTSTKKGFTLKTYTVRRKNSYEESDIFVDQIVTTADNTYERSKMREFPKKSLVCCFKKEYILSPTPSSGYGRPIEWTPTNNMTDISAILTANIPNKTPAKSWILFAQNGSADSDGSWMGVNTSQNWTISKFSTSCKISATNISEITIKKNSNSAMEFIAKANEQESGVIKSTNNPRTEIKYISFFGASSCNFSGAFYFYCGKIYDITNNPGILIGDLVPVKRIVTPGSGKSDYGLYDNVQHKFFGGSTSTYASGAITGPDSVATE